MAILTAQQLKDRETPERTVDIGNGDEVRIRRPDLQTLVFEGFLPTPLLNSVLLMIGEWAGKDAKNITEDVVAKSTELREFIDRWLCAAIVEPRVTLNGEAGTVAVTDLTLKTKVALFSASFQTDFQTPVREVAVATATEFPEVGSGAGSGPDGAAVREPSLVDSAPV